MHALRGFPRHLPPGIRKSFIILKYPCKALDGTVYWPGLQMARDSKEVWMGLMMDAGRIPEIGVTVDDGVQQHAVPVLLGPLTGPNGVPLRMRMYDIESQRWVGGASGADPPRRPSPKRPPPTYQVRL